jgi:hypothetical protein
MDNLLTTEADEDKFLLASSGSNASLLTSENDFF